MDESGVGEESLSYEEKARRATIISNPMASKKLAKKLTKLIRKASKKKLHLYSGLKLVQTKIRKGEKGLVVFAGNVSPIDVVCHMPAVCEARNIPYVFVPTGKDLGAAMGVKRSTLVVLIRPDEEYSDAYEECYQEVKTLPPPEPLA